MDLREAEKIAVGLASELPAEEIALESALNRVLAANVTAGSDLPGKYRSRWDGFALRGADTAPASPSKPVNLAIASGSITAGAKQTAAVGGRCFRIMTGAVLPEGTDAVIPFEDAAQSGERIVVSEPVRPEQGVISPGADAAAGDIILKKGDVLTSTRLALAAAIGIDRINVHGRPRVAILATGDELRDIGQDSAGHLTFCNNIHLFAAFVAAGGGIPVPLGIAPDDPEVIFSRLEAARADLILTTGGMGKGSRDFIREVWKRLGVKIHFDSLNLSPGRGSALGSLGGHIFLGLPGNPWAAEIVFEEIAAPVMRRFQGAVFAEKLSITARITAPIKKKKDSYRAFYGSLDMAGESATFTPALESFHVHRLQMVRRCPAYIVLGPDQRSIQAGETVEVKVPDLPLGAWAVLKAYGIH